MGKRRTHPAYLSDDEAARETRREKEMVEGFLRWNPITKIGETENFVVEYDALHKLLLIHGQQDITEYPFKLGFNENEIDEIIKLLVKGKRWFKRR